jgi:Ribbon-helix-helix domain
MSRRKDQTTVYLTPEQHEALIEISRRTRVPMAVMIRRGVDLALAEWAKEEGKASK